MAIYTEDFQKMPLNISTEQAVLLFRAVEMFIEQYEASMVGDFEVSSNTDILNVELTAIETVEAAHELRDQLIEQFGIV